MALFPVLFTSIFRDLIIVVECSVQFCHSCWWIWSGCQLLPGFGPFGIQICLL